MRRFAKAVAMASAMSLMLSGCATTSGDPNAPRTALDRSVGQCIGSIAAGAILGALLGAATGNRNVGKGAAIGAGVGTVACAVIIAMNNKEDRERLQQSRMAALKSGSDDTTQYTGTDGNSRVIHTSVQTVPVPSAPKTASANSNITGPCRRAQVQITLQNKGATTLDPETVCQTAAGDWVPLDQKTV